MSTYVAMDEGVTGNCVVTNPLIFHTDFPVFSRVGEIGGGYLFSEKLLVRN